MTELVAPVETTVERIKSELSPLYDLVDDRYEKNTSSPEILGELKYHYREVVDFSLERGEKLGLTEYELKLLGVAAVLHDLNKADPVPTGEHAKYVLVNHGNMAADKVDEAVQDIPSLQDPAAKGRIEAAIKAHMGPRPGFMQDSLNEVNQQRSQRGEPKIVLPWPEEGDQIAKILLAADMRSLASQKGREKVMALRSNNSTPSGQSFIAEDTRKTEIYKQMGINISVGEVALISGFKSAYQARDMFSDPSDRDWVNEVIEVSKSITYKYGDQEVRWNDEIERVFSVEGKLLEIINEDDLGITAEKTRRIKGELNIDLDQVPQMRYLEEITK